MVYGTQITNYIVFMGFISANLQLKYLKTEVLEQLIIHTPTVQDYPASQNEPTTYEQFSDWNV